MNFEQAFKKMLDGAFVTLPEWGGYWYWNGESVMIRTKYNELLDIRETKDVLFTITFTFRNDWKIWGGQ